jgi:hypothetical protein
VSASAPAVAAGRPLSARRFAALVGYVFRACLPARRLAVLALPIAAALACGLIARTVTDEPAGDAFAGIAAVGIFGLAMPLGTLVVGDAVLGAEARSGTLAFTWSTPARFAEIAAARWLGGWVVCLLTLVPASAIAPVLAGTADDAAAMAVATAASSAAHVALFVAVGALTRRAAVWSLAIVLLVERLLGAVLSGIAQLSPSWLGRTTYTGLIGGPEDMERSGVPDGWGAVSRLGLLTVVFLALATWGLRRMQLTGSRD